MRTARTVGVIAVNVFRESVRDRVLYNLVAFALLLIGASLLLGQLTAGQDVKIIKDLGLSAITIFGLFIAVFIGIGLVSKEVERRSIFNLLSKPIRRQELVAGKYAGLVLTLAVNVAVMTAALYLVLGYLSATDSDAARRAWEAAPTDPAMLKAIFLIFVELMLVTAIALFFSTFSSPILAASFTIGLVVVGQFDADLKNFQAVTHAPMVDHLTHGLYFLLPNMAAFDVKAQVVHALPVSAGYLAITTAYGLSYIAALLVASMVIFAWRDFR